MTKINLLLNTRNCRKYRYCSYSQIAINLKNFDTKLVKRKSTPNAQKKNTHTNLDHIEFIKYFWIENAKPRFNSDELSYLKKEPNFFFFLFTIAPLVDLNYRYISFGPLGRQPIIYRKAIFKFSVGKSVFNFQIIEYFTALLLLLLLLMYHYPTGLSSINNVVLTLQVK